MFDTSPELRAAAAIAGASAARLWRGFGAPLARVRRAFGALCVRIWRGFGVACGRSRRLSGSAAVRSGRRRHTAGGACLRSPPLLARPVFMRRLPPNA